MPARRLAPSAESDGLLDADDIDRCPAHDLHAAGHLVAWWRLCNGRLSELRGVGIEQPSAAMCDAWLVLGDEVARVEHAARKRAEEEAKRQREAAARKGVG